MPLSILEELVGRKIPGAKDHEIHVTLDETDQCRLHCAGFSRGFRVSENPKWTETCKKFVENRAKSGAKKPVKKTTTKPLSPKPTEE